ncbi:MAG: TerB family tellurite resistance protein [Alphaproteobacteria bacterium]|nr:TerB family tellurite resistance protein [Alphaproteobacteria bacterium]
MQIHNLKKLLKIRICDFQWENIKGEILELVESRIGDSYYNHLGKIIGGLFGLTVGGVLFCFFGIVGGHLIDRSRNENLDDNKNYRINPDTYQHQPHNEAFTNAIIALSAKMAKADRRSGIIEIKFLQKLFVSNKNKAISKLFNEAKKSSDTFEAHAEAIVVVFHDNNQMLEEIISILFAITKTDSSLCLSEYKFINNVAQIFCITPKDFERIETIYKDAEKANPYIMLGVDNNASNLEIKKAWHNLTRNNHPDTLIANGMPCEFIEFANKKMAVINSAYDKIADDRGIRKKNNSNDFS